MLYATLLDVFSDSSLLVAQREDLPFGYGQTV